MLEATTPNSAPGGGLFGPSNTNNSSTGSIFGGGQPRSSLSMIIGATRFQEATPYRALVVVFLEEAVQTYLEVQTQHQRTIHLPQGEVFSVARIPPAPLLLNQVLLVEAYLDSVSRRPLQEAQVVLLLRAAYLEGPNRQNRVQRQNPRGKAVCIINVLWVIQLLTS